MASPRAAPLTVIAAYEPDVRRCVQALVWLLDPSRGRRTPEPPARAAAPAGTPGVQR